MLRRVGFSALVLFAACGGKVDDGNLGVREIGTDVGPPITPPNGGSSSGSSGGLVVTPVTACKGAPVLFKADFETGKLTDSFIVSEPTAFTIDADQPIAGLESLQVNADAKSYIARKLANVCSVTLTFAVRLSKNIFQTGTNLASVNAGSRQFTVILDSGGDLHLAQSVTTEKGPVQSYSLAFATITPFATTITLEVDLTAGEVRSSATPVTIPGTPAPYQESLLPAPGPLTTPAISEVDLGTTPGVASDPVGVYWLDDITIQ